MKKLVVIGAGMASGRALEHLFEADPSAYEVTLFNAEPRGNYNRIMLSPVLSGEKSFAEIVTHDEDWYAANKVACRFGERVVAIDTKAKTVTGEKGAVAYDKLLIATGSSPFIIPVPGKDLKGVVAYRDLEDTNAMIEASGTIGAHAVVIGGGLLGLEAAAGLRLRGMEVTVVHLMGHLMERQLDEAAGWLLKRDLEKRGITILTDASTKMIRGTEKVEGVELADGRVLPADLVVMAVGIRPETTVAKAAGLAVGRGIQVSAQMLTSDPDVLALGECVEFSGMLFGLVAPLYDQAKVVAKTLLGEEAAFAPKELSTKLKVTGCDLFSAGDFAAGEGREDIVLRDPSRGVYRRVVLEGDRMVGAVMYGDTAEGGWYFDLIRDRADVSAMRDTLIFGQAYQGGSPLDPMAAVAALPDEAEICGCNGVCKGKITGAIASLGLKTVDDVRAHTKASASCGSCTGLVEQLLKVQLGDAYNPAAVQPMCPCTDHSHDDVRRLIAAQRPRTVHGAMQAMQWKTSGGCAKCLPALNYYLLATMPGEYEDDNQSRFINERVHANIQRDGTYSVVPRMWGGMTSAAELRAIADVVDKFAIPAVKVTGGQRIDMLGITKEQLPAVWADLNKAGLVSGHAYGKALRTVKTCVGTDWCRFGTQDSTGLGIKLEKFLWGSWTPAKVKLAVSGCPRNCAEATCKDIGVICVDSGYEIHFGGAAGLDIKGTEILGHADNERDTIEIVAALTQLYREQGRYLERIYKWGKRVGIETIKKQVVEDRERRRELFERFVHSQRFSQSDPWGERVAGRDAHEFNPLADFRHAQAAE
jgi:nitrite reductase (NADH) large subunit